MADITSPDSSSNNIIGKKKGANSTEKNAVVKDAAREIFNHLNVCSTCDSLKHELQEIKEKLSEKDEKIKFWSNIMLNLLKENKDLESSVRTKKRVIENIQ